MTESEWQDAIRLAVADAEAAARNVDKVVREAAAARVPYRAIAVAAGRSVGWVAGRVNGQ